MGRTRGSVYVVALAAAAVLVLGLAGCTGSDQAAAEGEYESATAADYLVQRGIAKEQAVGRDGGTHRLTLTNGSFTEAWTNALGEQKSCTGTYRDDGGRVTFTWISGCFGDWSASYAIDGDEVAWTDVEALPPYDSAEDQRQAEIFNAVPWTRTDNP